MLMSLPQPQNTSPEPQPPGTPAWFGYAMVSLLLASVLVAAWSVRTTMTLKGSLPGTVRDAVTSVQRSEAFEADSTWRPGQFAPEVPLVSTAGETFSFRDVAGRHDLIYLATDDSPICAQHFPELNQAAAKVGAAGGSMALIVYLRTGTLSDLTEQYRWQFPVYAIDGDAVESLGARGVPMAMVFRNGVLGDAFFTSSLDRLTTRTVAALKQ
jgi:hypothetical protein